MQMSFIDLNNIQKVQTMFPPQNNQGPAPQPSQQLPKCDEFFSGIPFVSLTFYIAIVALWFFDLFTNFGSQFLYNNLWQTVFELQLWRLFSCLFTEESLLIVIFMIVNCQSFLPMIEKGKGSTFLIVDLLTRNLKLQSAIFLFQYILWVSAGFYQKDFKSGASGLWFNYLTIFCITNPKTMNMCCCHIKFNRRFFPIIFYCFFSLICWQFRVDVTIGMIMGALQATLFKKFKDLLQIGAYQRLNALFQKISLHSFQNWVEIRPEKFTEVLQAENSQLISEMDRSEESTSTNSRGSKNTDPFSSHKGVRLGDY